MKIIEPKGTELITFFQLFFLVALRATLRPFLAARFLVLLRAALRPLRAERRATRRLGAMIELEMLQLVLNACPAGTCDQISTKNVETNQQIIEWMHFKCIDRMRKKR